MLQILFQVLDLEKLSVNTRKDWISLITHLTQPTATILREIQRTYYAPTQCLYEYSVMAATLHNHYQFEVVQKGKIERWEQSALEESDDKLSKSKYKTLVKLDELVPGMNHKHIMNSMSMMDTIWAIVVRETDQKNIFMLDLNSQDILCNTKMYEPLLYHFLSQRSYAITKNFEFIKQMRDKMVLEKLQDLFFYNLFNWLIVLSHKNEKVQKAIWKYRNLLVLEELGDNIGYGELELVNTILENDQLLLQVTDLENLSNRLIKRWGKTNKQILLEILAKITKTGISENNLKVIKTALKLPKEEINFTSFANLCRIALNVMKSDSIYSLDVTIENFFPLEWLPERFEAMTGYYINLLLTHPEMSEFKQLSNQEVIDERKEGKEPLVLPFMQMPLKVTPFEAAITHPFQKVLETVESDFEAVLSLSWEIYLSQLNRSNGNNPGLFISMQKVLRSFSEILNSMRQKEQFVNLILFSKFLSGFLRTFWDTENSNYKSQRWELKSNGDIINEAHQEDHDHSQSEQTNMYLNEGYREPVETLLRKLVSITLELKKSKIPNLTKFFSKF